MGPKLLWVVLILSVIVLEAGLSNGCWKQERLALLQLKRFFIPFKDEEISDCCQWEWVECNITTRRVTTLSLFGIRSDNEPKWYFNSSLFLPFEELRGLFLNENHMVCCVANEGFEKLSKLRHLEVLDLRGNNFKDSSTLLSSLSKISSLKSLSLAENHDLFTGSNHTNADLKWLSRMSGLETLDLSDTNLTNNFSLHLDGLFSLRTLILGQNKLEGTIHIEGNRRQLRLINLEVLDLSYNLLNSSILAHLNGFPNLKSLNLRHNQLKGLMDIKEFCGLSNLQSLDMSYNEVNQFVSSKENRCLTKLEVLYLDAVSTKQNFSLVSLLEPFSSLKTLSLRYNSYLNKTVVTQELHVLRNVEDLILDHTPLDINFLQSIGGLISLKTLSLYNCSLAGTLPAQEDGFYLPRSYPSSYAEEVVEFSIKRSSYNYTGNILDHLSGIDLSYNQLSGVIPPELGNLSEIYALNLSHNNLDGHIPSTFSKLKQIESLDLSYNNLNGIIPPQLTELNNLEIFSVAHNNLSGPLPDMKAQFGTFEDSSYEGNPLLCGPPLKNSCSEGRDSPEPPCAPFGEDEENDLIDIGDFYVSFVVSYVIILLATAIVLYINPYWRLAWFYFIEESSTACYFFIVDNLRQLPCFKRNV
ncbi:hypothetical protein DITRI_Ditri15bG0026400 [Diplodiscus trichospermus]